MAKKKRAPKKRGPRRSERREQPKRPEPGDVARLPVRLAMEETLRSLAQGLTGEEEPPARAEAREILHLAHAEDDPDERARLARQAIEVDPDGADAYVMLAEMDPSRRARLALFRQGVEAGARAIGPATFERDAGHFWGLIETRPYMRARAGLAELLWEVGRRDESFAEMRELLRLNPNDNQGLRYLFADRLLQVGRLEELDALLGAYDEETADFAYTRTLLAFRREGDSPLAHSLLTRARKANRYVPEYLTDLQPLPPEMPMSYGIGDRSEAALYVARSLPRWKETEGAIAWLKVDGPKPKTAKKAKAAAEEPIPVGPTEAVLARLRRLPRKNDVWQADCRAMPSWIEIAGERVRPWLILVTNRSQDLVVQHALFMKGPREGAFWDALARAMEDPVVGRPHRPSEVQMRAGRYLAELESITIKGVVVDELDHVDFVFKDLAASAGVDEQPSYLDVPGVKSEQVARFFATAAAFYRRAPWRSLGCEAAIRVACDRFDSGPWYAVVMGGSGLTYGVALYDDFEQLRAGWSGNADDEEQAQEMTALSLTFDEVTSVRGADIDARDREGWEVAGPLAFPTLFRKDRGMSIRPPLPREIDLMEGCLKALPDFVARYPLDDVDVHTTEVQVGEETLTFKLSWMD